MKYDAVGIHVFAGGFTLGVQKEFNVECQLEAHGPFGERTAREIAGVDWLNRPAGDWPHVDAQFAFGNPRCTGFSTITAGYGEDAHGAWSKPTADIHQLCEYAVGRYDAIIWESVQGAMKTGRPLLDYLRDDIFKPKHYRIAHILLNGAAFGNSQQRKRYFFVAYRDDKNFNIVPPDISPYYNVNYDAIWDMRHVKGNPRKTNDGDGWAADDYLKLTDNETLCVPHLPNGWCLNTMGRYMRDRLPDKFKFMWDARLSDMPFSMHCIHRMNWLRPTPTLHSSCGRFIHPSRDRPITAGEMSAIMGWGDKIPLGNNPAAELAKGIVPQAGTWLAQQVVRYLDNYWGDEDWESSFNPMASTWEGRDTTGELEKVFDLTKYVGYQFDIDRYEDLPPQHLCCVNNKTGQLQRFKIHASDSKRDRRPHFVPSDFEECFSG